jgi:dUTP pyrophosphatase
MTTDILHDPCMACLKRADSTGVEFSKWEGWEKVGDNTIPTKLINTTDPQFLPSRKYTNDAGADLRARIEEDILIYPGQIKKIPTGVAVELPQGHFGLILPRSGASKVGKVEITGTIDEGYRGELCMNIANMINDSVKVKGGERLAQLVVLPYLATEFRQVEELSETDRGIKGFGSTGEV